MFVRVTDMCIYVHEYIYIYTHIVCDTRDTEPYIVFIWRPTSALRKKSTDLYCGTFFCNSNGIEFTCDKEHNEFDVVVLFVAKDPRKKKNNLVRVGTRVICEEET